MRFICVFCKLTRDTGDLRALNTGDLLSPCRGIRFDFVVAGRTVFVVQTALQAVVGHGQIVNGGHQRRRAIGELQTLHWQFVQQDIFQLHFVEMFSAFATKVREAHFGDLILAAEYAQTQIGLFTGGGVALLEIPFPFFAPTETDRTIRCY